MLFTDFLFFERINLPNTRKYVLLTRHIDKSNFFKLEEISDYKNHIYLFQFHSYLNLFVSIQKLLYKFYISLYTNSFTAETFHVLMKIHPQLNLVRNPSPQKRQKPAKNIYQKRNRHPSEETK